MSIPYRDEQILRILAANPGGMTTAEIFKAAKEQRGNELPDANITSQRIYNLRNTKHAKINTHDTVAGKIHKITAAGLPVLQIHKITAAGLAVLQEIDGNHGDTVEKPITTESHSEATLDIIQQFDQAVGIIRDGLIAALTPPADGIEIVDKTKKITLLEQLENAHFFGTDDRATIAEIRRDIEQMEAA